MVLQTPKLRKTQRHEKVAQKWLSGLRPKWLKSDENGQKCHFWVGQLSFPRTLRYSVRSGPTRAWVSFPLRIKASCRSSMHKSWWTVTLAGALKVTLEPLFRVFEFFGVSGPVGLLPDHKLKGLKGWAWLPSSAEPLLFCARVLQQVSIKQKVPQNPPAEAPRLRGPNWGLFFVLKFVRSRGKISSTVSKVLRDRRVLFKHKNPKDPFVLKTLSRCKL